MKAVFLGLCLAVGLATCRPMEGESQDTTPVPTTSEAKEDPSQAQNASSKAPAPSRPKELYTTQYDNIDLEEILSNDRLFRKYFDCLTGEGKCTPDGKELKEVLPDALANNCEKCTERQRAGGEKVLKHMIEKRPKEWGVLEKLFDPEGVYRKKYKEEAEKRGIKLD